MKLFHTGTSEIREPDITHGRKNADFGQGFYLSPDMDFAYRWAAADSVINEYELDEEGLQLHRFGRDTDWFEYIFNNRRGNDTSDADVVIGPIANDTIFDTLGIISSGFLSSEDALKLLMVGPEFTQVAIKTQKALDQLRWTGAQTVERLEDRTRKAEQQAYDEAFGNVVRGILGEE